MSLRLLAAVIALFVLSVPARAQGLNFTFTFTGTSPTDPTYSGQITGEIYGLTDNSTGQATQVTLLSAPTGFGLTGPLNLQPGGTFAVSNGALQFVDFSAYDIGTKLYLNLDDNPYASNDELSYEGTPNINSQSPASSILATGYAPAAVPEPTQYDLLVLLAIIALAGGKRVRDRLKQSV